MEGTWIEVHNCDKILYLVHIEKDEMTYGILILDQY